MEEMKTNSINDGRQIELDIARGLAVLFMVLIHVQLYFLTDSASKSILGYSIDFLGGIPAAPVFMFLMGVGVIYSRNNTFEKIVRKAIILISLGYALNLFRGTLPNLLHWLVYNDVEFLKYALDELLYVDIFQFSGLALIVLAIIKKLNFDNKKIGILILIIGLANYLTSSISTNNYIVSAISALFIGANELSFFPLLSWIFYPLTGYIFGSYLITSSNKDLFYKRLLILSTFATVLLYYIFSIKMGLDVGLESETSYYHHQLAGNFIFLGFVLSWISILYFVSKVLPSFITNTLRRWSRNVSEIYIIHWLFIGWIISTMDYNTLSIPYYIVMVMVIFISSDFLADYYMKEKKSKKNRL